MLAAMVRKLQFSFDKFILDTERRELRGPTGLISVEPQVFDFLINLIRNRDRVVSKDDIIAAIWGGRIVSESVLTTRLNAARSAIGDSGAAQRLIKTLRRKGMRFVGDVREEQAFAIAAPPDQRSAPSPVLDLPDRPSIAVLPFISLWHQAADPITGGNVR
jgi:DNA-binding winged helix-turn-helix (wHTH) protein